MIHMRWNYPADNVQDGKSSKHGEQYELICTMKNYQKYYKILVYNSQTV